MRSEAAAAVGDQLGGVERGPGTRNDDGRDRLAPAFVGSADDGGLGDGGVGVQDVLDHPRVDVEPARDDHVLDPVGDVEVALGVDVSGVAGVQPAFAEGFGGGVGSMPVAAHQLRAARGDFADLPGGQWCSGGVDDLHLGARQRPPDAASRCGVSVSPRRVSAGVIALVPAEASVMP